MIHHYIATQSDPKDPVGTIINVSSGRAGVISAGGSSYNISKLATQHLTEHVHLGPSPPSLLRPTPLPTPSFHSLSPQTPLEAPSQPCCDGIRS
jgi:hypothetical protein